VSAGFDLPGGESTAAALRRAEQERDEARDRLVATGGERDRANERARVADESRRISDKAAADMRAERDRALAEVSGVRASLAELADEVEDLKGTLAMRTGQLKTATRERDMARAEVESARQELDRLRRGAA
jgi:uncharacterized coiled-coil DUF342 family protein